jgi:hypothetical protein
MIYNTYTSTNSGSVNYSLRDDTEGVKKFVEFTLKLIGVDLTYDEFIEMDDSDKASLIREFKINKIIE